jgi:two-component system, chemotaxis family, chemotaxis protein CheY
MANDSPIIALVDDDKIFQLTASKTIQVTAITDKVLQFENGEEALQYLKVNKSVPEKLPDFIFLDINMPYVDGWMFLDDFTKLKADLAKRMTIYMVSSSIDPRDIQRATSHEDAKQYVVKPVTKEKFEELLRKTMN